MLKNRYLVIIMQILFYFKRYTFNIYQKNNHKFFFTICNINSKNNTLFFSLDIISRNPPCIFLISIVVYSVLNLYIFNLYFLEH